MKKGQKHREESIAKSRKSHLGKHSSPDTEFKKGARPPITAFKPSHIPWNKNKIGVFSYVSRMKMGSSHRGKKLTAKHRKAIGTAGIGRVTSEETKKKLRESTRGIPRFYLRGAKNPNWRGGITPRNQYIRQTIETRIWREGVFSRDGYTCQKYSIKGGPLVAHHILNFSSHPELRFAIDNGITLSKKAHNEFHRIYGNRNNTREQIIEFLST